MNWGGLFVFVGLTTVVISTAPWGLLLLLLLVPLFWESNRSKAHAPEPTRAQPRDDAHVMPSAAANRDALTTPTKFAFNPPSLAMVPPAPALHVRRQDRHFQRHAFTPGWLYVARNELHAHDLFKVGYTTVSPLTRIRTLNLQSKGVTTAIGRFHLLHSRSVPMSYSAEQQVFKRLAEYRVSKEREFFRAPQSMIVEAVNYVANEAALCAAHLSGDQYRAATCPDCGRSQCYDFDLLPESEINLHCPQCGNDWNHDTTA